MAHGVVRCSAVLADVFDAGKPWPAGRRVGVGRTGGWAGGSELGPRLLWRVAWAGFEAFGAVARGHGGEPGAVESEVRRANLAVDNCRVAKRGALDRRKVAEEARDQGDFALALCEGRVVGGCWALRRDGETLAVVQPREYGVGGFGSAAGAEAGLL